MRKIRITYVVTNLKNTGPINQTYNLIRHLDREKFEPSVVTVWPEAGDSLIEKYRELDIPIVQGKLNKETSLFLGKKYVTKCLNSLKPDIVQGVGMPPYRMCLGYKEAIPYVVLRNYCYEDYPSQYGKMIGNIMAHFDIGLIKKQLRMGFPITTCSKSLSNIYEEKEKVHIKFIQNGVDVSRFNILSEADKETLRGDLSLPSGKVIYVYSGRLIERKNQVELIRAFIQSDIEDQATLLLLGDGPDMAMLKDVANNHKSIIFRGNVTNIEKYLSASDIYVSSSKSEGLPNGVLEAMACGLPVVLSNIPQHREVLDGKNDCGYLYQIGDERDLSKTLRIIMDADYKQLGKAAYRRVNDCFTDIKMSEHYSEYYRSIMKEN